MDEVGAVVSGAGVVGGAAVAAEELKAAIRSAAGAGLVVRFVGAPRLMAAWRELFGRDGYALPRRVSPFGRPVLVVRGSRVWLGKPQDVAEVRRAAVLLASIASGAYGGGQGDLAILARQGIVVQDRPIRFNPEPPRMAPTVATPVTPPLPVIRVRRRVRRHEP